MNITQILFFSPNTVPFSSKTHIMHHPTSLVALYLWSLQQRHLYMPHIEVYICVVDKCGIERMSLEEVLHREY